MKEKLLENWLDNASERSYQPVFVQLLTAQGHRVVHSTRHNVLEYGKDVLAISPTGRGCAYQLKGSPHGQRMGLSEFRRDIQPQLIQLISQPVIYPGFPEGGHDSYLVSNGFFEEEVQRAVDDLNRGPYLSPLKLMSRGEILEGCKSVGSDLWPSELDDTRALIELYAADGRDMLPVQKLASLLYGVLHLNPGQDKFRNASELRRALSSAALLAGISTARFSEAENHYAVAQAWTLFSVSALAAIDRHDSTKDDAITGTLALGRGAIVSALVRLWKEVQERKQDPLVEGDWLTDDIVATWRFITLKGAMTCLAICDADVQVLSESERDDLQDWLKIRLNRSSVWGESFVAAFFPWNVWMQRTDASPRPDAEAAMIARLLIEANHPRGKDALPNPHYSFEDITSARFGIPSDATDTFRRDSFSGSTFTAELLLHSLVRSNSKHECRFLWPDFTRLGVRRTVPDEKWQYLLLKIEKGVEETRIYEPTYEWARLKNEAVSKHSTTPEVIASEPWLLAMWWQVAPHRLTTDAGHAFVNAVFPEWGT